MASHFAHGVSPVMIGREPELAALEQMLSVAQGGRGRCILIAGEAGVGKSRLLDELRGRALARGFTVLQGNCFDQDVAYPFSLWIATLRGYTAWGSASQIQDAFGPLAAEFAKLLPELTLILPNLQTTPTLDPEPEKRRLFEALTRFVMRLATSGPLLIALEDLQWSDETSLEFLHLLMHRVAGHPILLTATHRSDEQPPQLARFLAQANRERIADELVLAPLTRSETAQIVAAILRLEGTPADAFVDLIMGRSEGNPFYIEEVLKTLGEAGPAEIATGPWQGSLVEELQAPASVHEVVRRRTEQLKPETRRILTLAAVAGQRFSLDLLEEVSGQPEEDLLGAVKDLIAAQFVVEESADQFTFRHALTRDAVYTSLLLRERQALHRSLGEAMERYWGAASDAHAAELAYHFHQAAVWDKALDYSQRAGEQAQKLFAPREALAHFSRALEAGVRLGVPPSRSASTGRAHAFELLGEFDAARSDYEKALEVARSAGDREGEWATLIDLGFLWQSRDLARAGDYFERALGLARALEEAQLIAQSLNRVGNWRTNLGRLPEGLSCHQEALALFEALGDRRETARTLQLLGFASYLVGQLVQGARYCEAALPILQELDDRERVVSALNDLCLRPRFDTEVLGDVNLRQLAVLSETALRTARSCGYRKGEADALSRYGLCLCRAGDYGRGLELLRRALTIAEQIEHRELYTTVHLTWGTEVYQGLLAGADAREHLETALEAAHELGSTALIFICTAYLAMACILQEDLAAAQELLNSLLPEDLPGTAEQTLLQRTCWAARVELELALGHPARALEIVDRLLLGTANGQEYGPHAVPRLTWLRARALGALGRHEEAGADLRGALDVARAQGQRSMLWRLHAELGRAYRLLGRRTDAQEQFGSARGMIQQLADSLPAGALRDRFLAKALEVLPAAPAPTPDRAAKQEMGGLTEREREVAALIAQGKSNRAIAAALVITERTVEAHITRILNKLDLRSRAEIAVWAVGKGLAQPRA